MLIKENYKFITFPVIEDDNSPSKIAAIYTTEFQFDNDSSFKNFISMVLSAANDFLSGRLSDWGISSFAFFVFTSKKTKRYTVEPYLWEHNRLLAFLDELLDMTWTKQTPDYPNYLSELRDRLTKLTDYYSDYFEKNNN